MTSPRGVPADGAEVKIRVVLVDDHTVVRQGLARLLREEPDMEIVGEASDGESAINLIRAVRPDVVLMDISMPRMNGIEATRIVHSELPDVRIIGLSMFEEDERAAAMRAAGATDYLSKSGPAHAVVDVIRSCSRPSGARNNAVETIKRAEPRMPAGLKVRRGNGRKPPPKSR
jgi:two-component system NarL family response regulator